MKCFANAKCQAYACSKLAEQQYKCEISDSKPNKNNTINSNATWMEVKGKTSECKNFRFSESKIVDHLIPISH